MNKLGLVMVLMVSVTVCMVSDAADGKKRNVLFIAVDDLRPELGCYGEKVVQSPNIDKLASEGVRFNRAYCQEAICGPSRASLMTGLRPDTSGIIENDTFFRDTVPDVVTLTQHFGSLGYTTSYIGKIFHGTMVDKEFSWNAAPVGANRPNPRPVGGYQSPENRAAVKRRKDEVFKQYNGKFGQWGGGLACGPVFEAGDVADNMYEDGYSTDCAVATLKKLKQDDKPFFLGVGFHKPHLPFIAPKKYFDLYNPADIKLADNPFAPKNAPSMGLHASFETRTRMGVPKIGDFSDDTARELIHAYMACVSYVDAQIGRILKELDRLGLRDNTVVMLWGDHGWHLGEHGIWGKATNYEIATRVPLIVSAPGQKARGVSSDALVELVDMYPSLCELAGLPLPEHLDGKSFAPLLDEPSKPWKDAAFSQFPCPALREWAANPLTPEMRGTFFGPLIKEVEERIISQQKKKWNREFFENHLMGYTMRTDRYRFVLWVDHRNPQSEPYGIELYDHQTDPKENVNLAGLSEHAELVKKLSARLLKECKGAQKESTACVVDLSKSRKAQMKSFGYDDVRWTEGFWAERAGQSQTVSLRKLWELAADPEAGHVLDNMRAAATGKGEHAGTNWQDAWLYKWIEAAACVCRETNDPWIATRMDEAIELIAAAQEDDGYISTQITAKKKPRFQDPREHEVYNMGHLLTAGCVHKRMTGKDSLFKVAVKTADFLCDTLGRSVSPAYAHNPSAIMGLVDLYRETGEKKYLDCAQRIVDARGTNPKKGGAFYKEPGIEGTDLIQDRTPLRLSKEVVGHNVFFTYLYAGAADVYLETGDQTLLPPLERLWTDLTQRKMSINGGVSPMGHGLSIGNDPVVEAVGPAYFLPNADSYNETCGQVGNFMWNYRMLAISGDAKYADIMELELYNGFLGGIGLDGESWFYRNSLRFNSDSAELAGGHNFLSERVLPGRKRICCPTNLLRTLVQLHTYFYSVDDLGLYVHHYGGSTLDGKLADGSSLKLTQQTDYPWDGKIRLKLDKVETVKSFAIRLRIPGWAQGATVNVNRKASTNKPIPGKYLFMKRVWKAGDVIEIDLPMQPRLMTAHPKVEQLRNQVAVMRGPVLYCLESTDLPEGTNLDNIYLPGNAALKSAPLSMQSLEMRALEGKALYRAENEWTTELYRPLGQNKIKTIPIRMIPYFAWNNRGPAAMTVWLPVILKD